MCVRVPVGRSASELNCGISLIVVTDAARRIINNLPLRAAPGPQHSADHGSHDYPKKLVIRFHAATYSRAVFTQVGQSLFQNYSGR